MYKIENTSPRQKQFLIVKSSALGDIVHAFPVLEYIRQQVQDTAIDWVVERQGLALVRSHPFVREAIGIDTHTWRRNPWSMGTWRNIVAVCHRLRDRRYDAVFDLQGNGKSAFFTLCAKARDKIGFGRRSVKERVNLLSTSLQFDPPPGGNIRDTYLFLVSSYLQQPPTPTLSISPSLVLSDEEQMRLAVLQRELKPPVLMVCFGSRWVNKQLSLKLWEQLLDRIANEFGLSCLIVWGSDNEKAQAIHLAQQLSPSASAVGEMSLTLWQALMQHVDGIIAVDSVGLHLGGLSSTPIFSLFGPSLASVYQPIGPMHCAWQGPCPYKETFTTRCAKLRTCPTGACLKGATLESIFVAFQAWWTDVQSPRTPPQGPPLP